MSRCLKLSTVAFALSAIFSVANAFEFDLTTETGTAGQYAGVANPVMDIDGDVVIHAKDVPSDIARAYGYWANSNSSRIINGNLDINIERVNNDPRVWSLRVENGASLSVNGDVLIRSSTVGAQLVGLAEYNNGLLNLSNSKTDISLESDTGRLIGIAVESDSTLILGETLVNINASDYAEGTLENPRWVQALYSAKGAIEALEDVTLNVTTYDDNQLINAGATTIRVVNLEGSAYNTSAQFNKDLNINVDAQAQRIIGVYVSGDTSSSEDLHAGVDVAGTLGINIQAISDYVTGIYAQGESGVTASGVSINIQSEKEGAVVYGIQSVANPKYYPGPGSVNVNENTLLKLSGKGDLVGVLSMGAMNDRGSFVGLNGSSVVNVVSEDGTAVGIAVQEQAYAEIANLTANIETKSTSLDKEAIGIDLDNAELRISGANSIYAQGGNATAISLEDSVLTLAGSITAIGETLGIQSGENAEILLNDEASLVTNSI